MKLICKKGPAVPRPAYLLYADAAGPFRVQTRGGARYLVLFIDDYTRRVFPFLAKALSEFFDIFKTLNSKLQAEFGRDKVIVQLLADNHKVHISTSMNLFCKQQGITQH